MVTGASVQVAQVFGTHNPGDWIEYGSDGSSGFTAEILWATDLSDHERDAALAGIFRR